MSKTDQDKVYHVLEHGISKTIRVVKKDSGLSQPAAYYALVALEKDGYIEKKDSRPHSKRKTGSLWRKKPGSFRAEESVVTGSTHIPALA